MYGAIKKLAVIESLMILLSINRCVIPFNIAFWYEASREERVKARGDESCSS